MSVTDIGLCRSMPFTFTRTAADGDDGLTLEGLAAVFGQRTVIDSWEGSFVEQIRKGAFRKTIREQVPVLQFDHGRHALVGSIPIGRITDISETDQGLAVTARLSDNWLIAPVRDAIRDKAVTGMSFRFDVIRQEWRDKDGKLITDMDELRKLLWDPGDRGPLERTLIELRCPELGPVVFPAYAGTAVGVRAAQIAGDISTDGQLRRDVLSALAAGGTSDVVDESLRRDVARAVLFGTRTETPDPLVETPSPEEPADAPPPGHPSEEDAPPAGHPSPTASEALKQYARLAYVTRESVGRRYA